MTLPPEAQRLPDLPDRHTCRAIRERAGLSRRIIAERLGCHEQSVTQWELGGYRVGGKYLIAYMNLLAELDREARQREATG